VTLDDALALIGASPDHRVLRRIRMDHNGEDARPSDTTFHRGLLVDVETTGLDYTKDKVIELGVVPFTYDGAGSIWSVGAPFHSYNDPGRPIPPEMTKINLITDEMVAGKSIDADSLAGFAKGTNLVIAHHAEFDRPFCEGVWPGFAELPWACSMEQVPWAEEGIEGRKLTYIASSLGYFYDAHVAVNDCRAAVFLLSLKLPSGRTGLSHLLDRALTNSRRVWAVESPFDTKDVLKARGYRWNDGEDGRYKAWHREIWEVDLPAESKFLRDHIYRRPNGSSGARSTLVTPLTRFTVRG